MESRLGAAIGVATPQALARLSRMLARTSRWVARPLESMGSTTRTDLALESTDSKLNHRASFALSRFILAHKFTRL